MAIKQNINKVIHIKLGFILCASAITWALTLVLDSSTKAQSSSLPQATFQTYGRNNTEQEEPTMGLHLQPGQSHTKQDFDKPYDPKDPQHPEYGLVHWERKKMPIHIWISPGLKLPELPFNELQQTRVEMVRDMVASVHPFSRLAPAPGWTPETNDLVASGIEEWRQFETEGLLSFDFTDDPKQAHVLIFFTDAFKDADAPGGIAIGGNTCSQYLLPSQMKQIEAQGKEIVPVGFLVPGRHIQQNPIVIELALSVNNNENKVRGAAAHEFGHALGIIGHSPYREDLMYVDRVVDELSPADKATIRALYHSQAQGML